MGLFNDIRKLGRSLEDGIRDLGSSIEDTVRNVGSKIDDKLNAVLDAALDDPLKAVASAAAIASGQWWALPAVNMVDAAIAGAPLNKILETGAKTAAIQYISDQVTSYVGKSDIVRDFGKDVSNWLDGNEWGADVPISDIEAFANLGTNGMTNVAKSVVNGIANSAAAGITAALTGKNITDAVLQSAALGGVQTAIQAGALGTAIKYGPEYLQRALATAGASGVLGESMTKGFTGSLLNSAMSYTGKRLEDSLKAERPDLVKTFIRPDGTKSEVVQDPMEAVRQANTNLKNAAARVNNTADYYNFLVEDAKSVKEEADKFYQTVTDPDSYKTWIQNEYLAKGFPNTQGALNEYIQSQYALLTNNANAAARTAQNWYDNEYKASVNSYTEQQGVLEDQLQKAVEFDARFAAEAASDLQNFKNMAYTLAEINNIDLDKTPTTGDLFAYYDTKRNIADQVDQFLDSDNPYEELYQYALETNPDFVFEKIEAREDLLDSGKEPEYSGFDAFLFDKSGYNEVKELNPNFDFREYREINDLDEDVNPFQHYLDIGKDLGLAANKQEAKELDLSEFTKEEAQEALSKFSWIQEDLIRPEDLDELVGKTEAEGLKSLKDLIETREAEQLSLSKQRIESEQTLAGERQKTFTEVNDWIKNKPFNVEKINLTKEIDQLRDDLFFSSDPDKRAAAQSRINELLEQSRAEQGVIDKTIAEAEIYQPPASVEDIVKETMPAAPVAQEKQPEVTDKAIAEAKAPSDITQPQQPATVEDIVKETLPPSGVEKPATGVDRTDELLKEIEKFEPQGYYPALGEEFVEIDYGALDPNIPTPLGFATESTQMGKGLASGYYGQTVGVPLTIAMARDANRAAGYQQQLDLYDLVDQGRVQEASKLVAGNRALQNELTKYQSYSDEERAEARNRRMESMKEVSASVLESARLYNQFRKDMQEKYGADVPELSDIRTSDVKTFASDFGKWLAFNAGAGGTSIASTMLGALVGGAPGAYMVSATLGYGEALAGRMKFLDEALKDLPEDQRADAIIKYLNKTQGASLLTGATIGALDLAGPVGSLLRKRLTTELVDQLATQTISKAVYQVPREMLEEGFTGALQEMTKILGEKYLDENPTDLLSMDTVKRLYSSAAAEAAGSLIGSGINISTAAGAQQWKEKTLEIANKHFIDELQAGQPLYKDLLNPTTAADATATADALSKLEDSMAGRSVTKADLYGTSFPETPVNLNETLYKGKIVEVGNIGRGQSYYDTDNGYRIIDPGDNTLVVYDKVNNEEVELSPQERQDLYETNISKYKPRPVTAEEVQVFKDEDGNIVYDMGSGYQAIEDSMGNIRYMDTENNVPIKVLGEEGRQLYTNIILPNKPAPDAQLPTIPSTQKTEETVTETDQEVVADKEAETEIVGPTTVTKPVDTQQIADDLNKNQGTTLTKIDVDNLVKDDTGREILGELGVSQDNLGTGVDTSKVTKPVDTGVVTDTGQVTGPTDVKQPATTTKVVDTGTTATDVTPPAPKIMTDREIADDVNKKNGTKLTENDVKDLLSTDVGKDVLQVLGVDPVQINNRPAVDTKPTVVDTKPTVVDTKPTVVETKPVTVDTKPVVVDTKPVVVDTKPVTPNVPQSEPPVQPPPPPLDGTITQERPDGEVIPPEVKPEPPVVEPEVKPEPPVVEPEPPLEVEPEPKPFVPKFNFPRFPTPQFPMAFLPYLMPGGIQSVVNQPFYFNLPEEFDITRAFSPTLYEEMSEEE